MIQTPNVAPADLVAEFERVRIQAQKIRAHAICSRIMTARTFCGDSGSHES